MGKVNGGARLSYVRLGVTLHGFTTKAVMLSLGAGDQTPHIWLPRTCLSFRSEKHLESQLALPVYCVDVEIVKWKADQLGWKP